MNRANQLKENFKWNTSLIQKLVDGIEHEESIFQLPFPTNCLNWVLGHILVGRNKALSLLKGDQFRDDETLALYKSGSEPIKQDGKARNWDSLIMDLDESQIWINKALDDFTEDELQEIAETDQGSESIYQLLTGRHWHETYHLGQLEILSQHVRSSRLE
jgi:uncharacterized damage-inducible protein DinB